jgi:membrane protease YdiL (CAAX protease family)
MTIGGVEFDLKLTFLIILGTILPMLDYYKHQITGTKAYDRVVLYFIIPMIVILLLFQERPADYGFKLGNWREGLLWVVGVCAVMAVILFFLARTPAMQAYYQAKARDHSVTYLIYITAVDLWGWEFIWRGLLLFGLARVLGPGPAIFLQAVPFAFMHLGKPELETLSTIFGGAGFAFIAWRTGSFAYPVLIHWFIASFTMLVATGGVG